MNILFFGKEKKNSLQHIPSHNHDCHEIVFYSSNASGYTIVDGKKYRLEPYCVSIINKKSFHREVHSTETTVFFIGIDAVLDISQSVYCNMHSIKPIFEDIAKEFKNQETSFEDVIAYKIKEIIIKIKRSFEKPTEQGKELIFFKQYIDENYMQKISVRQMANISGYSYDHFRHLFTEIFGISPQKYLIDRRISTAVELLKTTKYSCTEIAYFCGFSDSSQMTKMLKQRYLQTPKTIRSAND